MKRPIKLIQADGSIKEEFVDEKVAETYERLNREEENANRRYRYHNPFSLDALAYQGMLFASHEDTPAEHYEKVEALERVETFKRTLTEIQLRRLGYFEEGLSEHQVARIEKVRLKAIQDTRRQLKKKASEFFDFQPNKKGGKQNG